MAGGLITTSYPTLDEHEGVMDQHRRAIVALKEKNAHILAAKQKLLRASDKHTEDFYWLRKSLTDLEDRAKYLHIATAPPPGEQLALGGPPPHEFYQEQARKVKHISMAQLTAEAVKFGGLEGPASPARRPKASPLRRVPSNFSPFCGETQSSLTKKPDNVIMGLRSPTHWSAGKKPGNLPRLLPREPGTSEINRFREHTASWMARSGTFEMSRSRAYISALSTSLSSPSL